MTWINDKISEEGRTRKKKILALRYETFAYDHSFLTLEFLYVRHDTRAPGIRRSLVPFCMEIVGSFFPAVAIAIVINFCSIGILLRQHHSSRFYVSLQWTKFGETPNVFLACKSYYKYLRTRKSFPCYCSNDRKEVPFANFLGIDN
jgi:hypothetical protein